MNPLRVAILGTRHSHVLEIYDRIIAHPGLALVAVCEENPPASLLAPKGVAITHTDFRSMLREVECDIVVLSDCFGKRGAQAVAALKAGRHILADKPLCTSLGELDEIQKLAAGRNLRVGMLLETRDRGNFLALRDVLKSGRIGGVQTISISCQHPLLWGKRPAWYFEPGLHGGTFNDIAIHIVDILPWLTGLEIARFDFARAWNAKAVDAAHFADCGQFALRLSNGAGVVGDVSYLAPDGCGYTIPHYWRILIHGTRGLAETSHATSGVIVITDADAAPAHVPPAAPRPGGFLEDFLAEIAGDKPPGGLDTSAVLRSTRRALELQAFADAQTK